MCVSVAMVRCVRGTTGVCVCAGWEEDVCVHGVGRVCMQGCEEGVCVCAGMTCTSSVALMRMSLRSGLRVGEGE